MANEKFKNPYEEEIDDPEIRISPTICWFVAGIFLGLMVLPPLLRNLMAALETNGWIPAIEFFVRPTDEAINLLAQKKESDPRIVRQSPNFIDHRESWELKLEGADFTEAPRRHLQAMLTAVLQEGNRKTVMGEDGWLFFRPAIVEFARQLQAEDVELMLVPIPVKPMIYGLNGKPLEAPLLHKDAPKFYAELEDAGVTVLDLAPLLSDWAKDTAVFLKQDTHWNPRTMERCARFVSDTIRRRPWFEEVDSQPNRFSYQPGKAEYIGDLVEKLDFPEGRNPFNVEKVSLTHVINTKTREPAARHLGLSVDTIAQNGQASTGVRRTLASRPGALEGKKLVIWAIAARDLFLSETVARETNVEWRSVAFNPEPKPKELPVGALVVKGEMIERAAVQDPKTVPYPASLYAAKYRITEVIQGDYMEGEVLVFHWGFRERKLLPSAAYQVGDSRELVLVPFDSQSELQSINRADLDEFLLLPFWAIEE